MGRGKGGGGEGEGGWVGGGLDLLEPDIVLTERRFNFSEVCSQSAGSRIAWIELTEQR